MLTRRAILPIAAGGVMLVTGISLCSAQTSEFPLIRAFRNPGCGCCEKWAEHLKAAGFEVTMADDVDLAGRRRSMGVPDGLAGCHLAEAGPYVIEGHVPAPDLIRLLKERPDALGLSVPGMPVGSPGMEVDGDSESYAVLLLSRDGSSSVYSQH